MKNLNKIYNKLRKENIEKWVNLKWNYYNKKLEMDILPFPREDFLIKETILGTMFVSHGGLWLWKQLKFLKKTHTSKFLYFILKENEIGKPLILNKKFETSHNVIHTFYHYANFRAKIGKIRPKNIVEWGGGYGCMAKLINKLYSHDLTYTIIDLPLLSCLQYYYLSEIFGREKINIIASTNGRIEKNKVNILPICFLEKFKLKSDFFISTWALSESSKYSQDYVKNKNYFGADNLLLAYSKGDKNFPRIIDLEKDLLKKGAIIEKIKYLSKRAESFYLLK